MKIYKRPRIIWSNYCGTCQQIHEPSVACDGTPIDWPARQAAALAWLRRDVAKRESRNSLKGYPYDSNEQGNAQS